MPKLFLFSGGSRGNLPKVTIKDKRDKDWLQATINSAPHSRYNKLVFCYDYQLGDYDILKSINYGFYGDITKQEIEKVIVGLKRTVSMYKVPKSGYAVGDDLFCLFGFFGDVLVVVGILAQKWAVSLGGFFACVFLGIVANCLIRNCFYQRLLRREKQIKAFLDRENRKLKGKKIEWITGDFGAYLVLVYDGPEYFLEGRRVGLQPTQTRLVLNTEVDVKLSQKNRAIGMPV